MRQRRSALLANGRTPVPGQKLWRRVVILVVAVFAVSGSLGSAGVAAAGGSTTAKRGLPSLPNSIGQRGRFIIGVKCDLPPFGSVDTQGRHVGYEIQIARELSRLAFHRPNRVRFVCVTTTSRIPSLQSGRVDMVIATLSWTRARAKQIAYSAPYFGATGRLLVRSGSGITSLSNLRGQSVVTTAGSVYVTWAGTCLKGTTLRRVDGTSAAVAAVADGDVDGFLYDDAFLERAVADNSALTLTSDRFLEVPYGIGIRKANPALLRWVDAALGRMKAGDLFYRYLRAVAPSSGLTDYANQVPRPHNSLAYPSDESPETDCRIS
jgi:polar amino acid transport system substrate-binding protein